MTANTTDLVIGMLIGAVIVLAYTSVYFYLWGMGKKKDYDKLFEEYSKKCMEYNALHYNHDYFLKQYDK